MSGFSGGSGGTDGADAVVTAASETSLEIGTGEKVFTVALHMTVGVGTPVIAASEADPTKFMFGIVTANSGTTLTVDVTAVGGAGTLDDWIVTACGFRGPAGETGPAGADGEGVPAGGTENQILAKASGGDFDTEWVDAGGGGSDPSLLEDGAAGTPAYSFSDDTDTGMYRDPLQGPGMTVALCFAVGGAIQFAMSDAAAVVYSDQLLVPDGSAAAPSVGFVNDADCGIYIFGIGEGPWVGIAVNGTLQWYVGPTGNTVTVGTAFVGDGGVRFTSDSQAGMLYSTGEVHLVAPDGSAPLRIGNAGIGFYGNGPLSKQTGVAVTAEAIHAALVNLGLISS